MFSLGRRGDPDQRRNAASPAHLDPRVTTVSLSAGLAETLPTLVNALGDRFAVVVDEPDSSAVALVAPIGAVGVAFFRIVHPVPALVVVDHGWANPEIVAACLDAGAGAYIASRSATEVAACIRNLVGRADSCPGATAVQRDTRRSTHTRPSWRNREAHEAHLLRRGQPGQ